MKYTLCGVDSDEFTPRRVHFNVYEYTIRSVHSTKNTLFRVYLSEYTQLCVYLMSTHPCLVSTHYVHSEECALSTQSVLLRKSSPLK